MRWQTVITYRTERGPIDVIHHVEELDEIADLIEAGPDWNTVESIHTTLHRVCTPNLTVEASEQL